MKAIDFVFASGATESGWIDLRDAFGTAEEAMKYVMCAAETPAPLEATTLSFEMTWDVDNVSPTAKTFQRDDGTGTLETASVPLAVNKIIQLPISEFPVLAPKIRGKINTGGAASATRTIPVIFRKIG